MVSTRKPFHHPLSILSSGLLTGITLISAFILSSSPISAVGEDVTYTSTSANASVVVSAACTMTGSGMNSHTAEVPNGTYRADIGTTTIKVTCNDPHGFAIYAIGFSNDEYTGTNHTKLIGTNDSTKTIATGTATSGSTSNWAMKLATNSSATYPITLTNGYGSYSNVPDTYTKVAQRTSGTDVGTGATGSELTTTYAAFVSSSQPADTYVGKVKYTMVHPYNSTAPEIPPVTCSTPVPNITYMQEINSSNRSTVLASLTEDAPYYITDNRDDKFYCVSKLKDGNLWMLDNLRLDPTAVSLAILQGNTNASDQTLTYFKNGGGIPRGQYAVSGVSADWALDGREPRGWYVPYVYVLDKNNTVTSWGAGSGKIGVYYNYCAAAAGSYCYGNGETGSATTGDATEDICPTGWRMPTGGSSGEYQALYTAYSSNLTNFKNALSIPLSGILYDGIPYFQNTYGFFWSSTRQDDLGMWSLYIENNAINPAKDWGRTAAFSVRCVLK